MAREEVIGGQTLVLVDCLTFLPTLPDSSVDLVLTDPPYFRVKNLPWDRQWEDAAAFIAWIGRLCEEWQRVLKPNGSLYVFASPKMAARVECEVGRWFEVLNRIRWVKEAGWHQKAEKEALRSYVSPWEECIFAEQFGADSSAKGEAGYGAACDELRGFVFEPLRAYLDGERLRAGVDKVACNVACGFSATMGGMAARHYFGQSQWQLPTAEHYAAMRDLFNAKGNGSGPFLQREHEDLRREYEDLRRPFAVTADVPYTDVWDFPTVQAYKGKHPCEKPEALLSHIIKTSSRPGDLVLDCFAGGGSTGCAAVKLGRRFIGVELDPHWAAVAERRIAAATAQAALTGPQDESQPSQDRPSGPTPKCELRLFHTPPRSDPVTSQTSCASTAGDLGSGTARDDHASSHRQTE